MAERHADADGEALRRRRRFTSGEQIHAAAIDQRAEQEIVGEVRDNGLPVERRVLDRELYAHAVARFDAQLLALPAARAAAPEEAEPEEEALAAAPRGAAEAEDRVAVLGRLRAQGLLQDAEYDAAVAATRRSAGGTAS